MFDLPEAQWEYVGDDEDPGFGWRALPKSMQKKRDEFMDLMENKDGLAMAEVIERIANMDASERDALRAEDESSDSEGEETDPECVVA
jgi:hypothetical protein